MRRILDLSLFQEVWYTGEQELLVTFRVAEQNLSIKVHSFKLQLDYGARMTEYIQGSRKRIGLNIPLSQNSVKCGNLLPRSVYLW
jgi:hypothetical protein